MSATCETQKEVQKEVKVECQPGKLGAPVLQRRVVVPQTQLQHNDKGFTLTALMAGVPREAVEVRLEGRFLNLRGKVTEPSWEGFERAYGEFGFVDYECAVKIPQEVNLEGIQAQVENGVLRVQMPKLEAAAPRKIQIEG